MFSVDAINLSGDARIKTLNIAAAPAAIELYFFLQAWFQAAPQAVFQTHLLFRERSVPRDYRSGISSIFFYFFYINIITYCIFITYQVIQDNLLLKNLLYNNNIYKLIHLQ